jgi:hypothetical protein
MRGFGILERNQDYSSISNPYEMATDPLIHPNLDLK